MSKDENKYRERFFSDSKASTFEQSENNQSSITVKPQDDPDAPPTLELEALKLFESFSQQIEEYGLEIDTEAPKNRQRSRSEDNQLSIIGFLQKKVRNRNMSQEFQEKPAITVKKL